MKYVERNPDNDRFITLLGLFYATNDQVKDAESLYSEVIQKLERDGQLNYNLVMTKNLLGRLLMRYDERQKEAMTHLKESEKLAGILPYWWTDLQHVQIETFDI